MIVIRRQCGRWMWCCHLCRPPARGSRNDWADIIRISLPRHFRVRHSHHEWARKALYPMHHGVHGQGEDHSTGQDRSTTDVCSLAHCGTSTLARTAPTLCPLWGADRL